MRKVNAFRWLLATGALSLSCVAASQSVRISEIHYDNTGTDAGEAIEISAPAGTDLTGWTVVLYNGSGGASYGTTTLSGPVPATCGARGVVVLNYPSNGIQNGAPDGIALIDSSNAVVEFLSYEGTFAATNGPALGLTSVDIGASQNGTEPVGASLQRDVAGVWSATAVNSFGACNDDGETPPDPEVASVTVAPANATVNVGASLALVATARDAGSAPIGGTTFIWSSSDPAVANVSGTGSVTGVAVGQALITATAANGIAGSSAVQVNDPPPPTSSDFRINEIHYDNAGADTGEAIEIEGPAGADVTGFSLVLYNLTNGAVYNTQVLSGVLPVSCDLRGVMVVSYPADGIQNGPSDGIALVNSLGQVLEFLSYEGVLTATNGPAAGMTSVDILASQTNAAAGQSLQRDSAGVWAPGASSFGACNPDNPVPGGNSLQFSGRVPSDPPLPVGYEDQLFATLRSPGNVTIPTTILWTSETPAIASIDQNGVMRALGEGTATVRATAADGTTATYSLPTRVAVAGTTAQYANNAEFGEPVDADSSDDVIVRYPQFTSSYNPNRGSPNWVAYQFDATHFGAEDRCDCFTMDPSLPASFTQLTTADYTNSGAYHGYGIDRGHLARSFDRTSGALDNAVTYLFTNIIAQAADQNQGPWAQMENELGDYARLQDREVYVIAGVAGNQGTLKDEGKVVIPTHTWKVALILPRDQGLSDLRDYRDVQSVAVIMPNVPGVRNVPWQNYIASIDEVEELSGYDLLALLPDDIETAVESGTQPPIAAIAGPAGAIAEGDSVSFNASASVDPNGSVVSYAWDYGDGATGSGVSVTHTYVQDGAFTVRLTVTDNDGLVDSETFTVTVTNVAPVVGAVPDATLNVGATYTAAGSFTDPGTDSWTATVNWGDGSAPEVVSLSGRSFSLTHVFATAGTYTVTVEVADDDTSTLSTHAVTVNALAPGLAAALPLIDQLVAAGKMPRAIGLVFKAQVIAAQVLVGRGNSTGAAALMRITVAEIDLLVRLRVLKAADMAPLRALLLSAL